MMIQKKIQFWGYAKFFAKSFTNTNVLSWWMNNEKPWKLTCTMTVMLWVMGPDFLTLSANCSPSFTITAVSTKLTDNWPAASDSKLDSKIIRLIRTLKFTTKLSGTSEHWTIRHIRAIKHIHITLKNHLTNENKITTTKLTS